MSRVGPGRCLHQLPLHGDEVFQGIDTNQVLSDHDGTTSLTEEHLLLEQALTRNGVGSPVAMIDGLKLLTRDDLSPCRFVADRGLFRASIRAILVQSQSSYKKKAKRKFFYN